MAPSPDAAPIAPKLSLREQQKQYTRQRLLDAAKEVFDRQGYAATTVDDIVAATGASRATFYLHFRSKLEIAREFERVAENLEPLWQRLHAMATEGVTEDAIALWLEEAFAFYTEHRLELQTVNEAVAVEPELREDVVQKVEHAIDAVAPLIAQAHPGDEEDARVRAAMLVWQHERFAYFWILRGVEFEKERVLRAFTDVWMHALGRPARAAPKRTRAKR
jgi:AcrR family transcriptional regulator